MGLFDNLFNSNSPNNNQNNRTPTNGGTPSEPGKEDLNKADAYYRDSDDRFALYYYDKAARAGNVTAMFKLAEMYRQAKGTRQNLPAAKAWYENAASRGHVEANAVLGLLYENASLEGGVNYDLAQNYISRAIQLSPSAQKYKDMLDNVAFMRQSNFTVSTTDDPKQYVKLAEAEKQKSRAQVAFYYYVEAARLGDSDAQRAAALALLECDGAANNLCETLYWLVQSAYGGGNMYSFFILARMFEYGTGVEQQKQLALELFNVALSKGHNWSKNYITFLNRELEQNPQNLEFTNIPPEKCLELGQEANNREDYITGKRYLMSSALRGNVTAQNDLGLMYLLGRGGISFCDAAFWTTLASVHGVPASNINLGYMFENGMGFAEDLDRAAYYYSEAVKAGLKDAEEMLERVNSKLPENRRVKAEPDTIFTRGVRVQEGIQAEAEKGDPESMYKTGLSYISDDNFPQDMGKAAFWLRKATEAGVNKANLELGRLYLYGALGSPDYAEAERCFLAAEKAGISRASSFLKNLIDIRESGNSPLTAEELSDIKGAISGCNSRKQFYRAMRLTQQTALAGDGDAMRRMGLAALRAEDYMYNLPLAVFWLLRGAVIAKNKFCAYIFARMVLHGTGVVCRRPLALEFYGIARDNGHANGQEAYDTLNDELNKRPELIDFLELTPDQCTEKAIAAADSKTKAAYYLSAALRGQNRAQNDLGLMFLNGEGVERNPSEAVLWLTSAYNNGNGMSAYNLGCMFRDGAGLPKDIEMARALYNEAVAMGNANAKSALNELNNIRTEQSVFPPKKPAAAPASPAPSPAPALGEDGLPENLDGYFADVVGMASVKDQLEKIYQFVKVQIRRESILRARGAEVPPNKKGYNFVLLGNPGTGKTTVARIIARILCDVHLRGSGDIVEVDRSKIVGSVIGETEEKMSSILNSAHGGTLFIDEAYALYREDSANDFGREAIDLLMKDMEDNRDSYSVIIAGYKKEMMNMINNANPGFKSRFNYYIEIPDYTDDELVEIAKSIIAKQQYTTGKGVERAIKKWINHNRIDERFGNARAMRELVETAIENQAMRISSLSNLSEEDYFLLEPIDFWEGADDEDDISIYLKELNALTGLASVKREVGTLIDRIKVNEIRESRGLDAGNGFGTLHMAFKGNAGTGKTTVARIIGKLYNAMGILKRGDVFVECSRADLVGQHLGETAIKTKKAVESALGGILFVDEAYALCQGENDSFGKEAVDTLVAEMENRRDSLIVIFAGYSSDIDRFFENNQGLQSRVPIALDFEDYSVEEMFSIMKYMLAKNGLALSGEAEPAARALIAQKAAGGNFGNARGVRNLVDDFIRRQNVRIAAMTARGENISNETLTSILPEDIG